MSIPICSPIGNIPIKPILIAIFLKVVKCNFCQTNMLFKMIFSICISGITCFNLFLFRYVSFDIVNSIKNLSRELHSSGWRGIESNLLLLNLFIFHLQIYNIFGRKQSIFCKKYLIIDIFYNY